MSAHSRNPADYSNAGTYSELQLISEWTVEWGERWGNELRCPKDRCSCSLRVGVIAHSKARAWLFLVQVSKECAGFAGKIKWIRTSTPSSFSFSNPSHSRKHIPILFQRMHRLKSVVETIPNRTIPGHEYSPSRVPLIRSVT